MPISVVCPSCQKRLNAPDEFAGKKAKCPKCGQVVTISPPEDPPVLTMELEDEKVSVGVSAQSAARSVAAKPSPPANALQRMECRGCGSAVDYRDGQGLFKCQHCGSVFESVADQGGGFAIHTVKLIERMAGDLDDIKGMQTEERLQKKAASVQDKIDYKYIEFDNSAARKAGSAAWILWIIGVFCLFFVFGSHGFGDVVVRLILVGVFGGAGYLCFQAFKKGKAEFEAESARIRQEELEPIYQRLRAIGAVMADGTVSIGYTESTSSPMKYCVACHKNITPAKPEGASFAGMSGINLMLTIFTCGMWLPAWILTEVLARGGSSAVKITRSGKCPSCGNTSLLPARVPNV